MRRLVFLFLAAAIAGPLGASLAGASEDPMVVIGRLYGQIEQGQNLESAVAWLRDFVATRESRAMSNTDSLDVRMGRLLLFKALHASNAPTAELLAAADSAGRYAGTSPEDEGLAFTDMAQALSGRPEALEASIRLAEQAVRLTRGSPAHVQALRVQAHALIERSDADLDAGIGLLWQAMEAGDPDSAWTLYRLGRAYERKRMLEQASSTYLRSAAVYPAAYPKADSALRAVARQVPEALRGLDERLAQARAASRQQVVFESRRRQGEAPDWTLPVLSGRKTSLSAHRGQVVVVDFWGTWCGPCRESLPRLDRLAAEFRDLDVTFFALDVEQELSGRERLRQVRQFVREVGLRVPVVLAENATVEAYQVEGFPTTCVIDRTGRLRFQNAGGGEAEDDILRQQIVALLAEPAVGGRE